LKTTHPSDRSQAAGDAVPSWQREGLLDYASVRPHLPVLEESITPVGPSSFAVDVAIASTDAVSLVRAQITARSVGVTVLDPAYTGFLIPLRTTGECHVNGEAVTPSAIYMPGSEGELYVRSAGRDVIGVAVLRDRLIETIAALRGVDPDDVTLDDRKLELAPATVSKLHARLAAILAESVGDALPRHPQQFVNEVLGAVTDAYLYAGSDTAPTGRRNQRYRHIVRRAEERFVEAQADPISLADLCAAAGASKSALYLAFHLICGEPPLEYFRKRRLTQARSRLLNSAPERGAVKRAALDVGLTELGRFAVEYRHLFGESPSASLGKSLA
jgi:AraC-like DNA-binding protein